MEGWCTMSLSLMILDSLLETHRIQNKWLWFFGHLNLMNDERYPKIAYSGYVQGTRKRGRPKKRWIDMVREDCEELHMILQETTCMLQDRRVWRVTVDQWLMRAMASPGP